MLSTLLAKQGSFLPNEPVIGSPNGRRSRCVTAESGLLLLLVCRYWNSEVNLLAAGTLVEGMRAC
jgi:hypothetical protein